MNEEDSCHFLVSLLILSYLSRHESQLHAMEPGAKPAQHNIYAGDNRIRNLRVLQEMLHIFDNQK